MQKRPPENKRIQNPHAQPSPLGAAHQHTYRWRRLDPQGLAWRVCDCDAQVPEEA